MSFKALKKGKDVYVYKRTGKFKYAYRVIFKQNGINLNEALLDVIDDDDAIAKARRRIAEVENRKALESTKLIEIKTKSPMVRFETIMDQVIESKRTASTRKQVKHFLKSVCLPIIDEKCPFVQNFTPTGPEDFITWFQTARPGQKVFNPRKYFFQVLRRAKKLGLLNADVEIEAKNPDPKRKKGKVYNDEEIKALFKNADGELELQLLMAFSMGMRKSEILKLRWDRLNIFHQTIALRAEDTKIREGREFRVPPSVWARLIARRKAIGGEYVFPSPHNANVPVIDNKTAWTRCKKDAKVKGRFHDLRHTYLTNEIIVKKKHPTDVCAYAGLSLEELKTYLHPTHLDTAYLADGQEEKIISILSIKKNFNTFFNTFQKEA